MNKMLITSAGLAEIVNAEQSGTAPVVLSHVGFGTGQYTPTADMTALKSEFKRFDSVAGGAIGDNVIHLTIHDNSIDAYDVNEIGVFTENGTLFAVCSATKPFAQKAAASEIMLVVDITLTDIDPDSITVGDTNIVLNPATTETAGTVELATADEAKAGTDTKRAMTPATAKAARDADANIVHRTGNETIAGAKTFSQLQIADGSPYVRVGNNNVVKGTNPESGQYWGISFTDSEGYVSKNRLGLIETIYSKDGNVSLSMGVYKPEHNNSTAMSKISLVYPADGDPYATAPTPAAGDNSTKIVTTAWANAKFLPLAGGTMSGEIKVNSDVITAGLTDDRAYHFNGGKTWTTGSYLVLTGNDSPRVGRFVLGTGGGETAPVLLGDPSGALSWQDKNIVRSVNGKNADAAGNANITATDVDALPTSGGTMTVYKAIYRDVNDSYLSFYGGTGTDNDGAQMDLCGSNHSSMPGVFQLHARNGDLDKILRGQTDGKLTWDGKYVLNNSYMAPNDTGAIMLTAGTAAAKGAHFRLYGASHSSGAGQFNIAASDGSSSKALVGKADGTLTWNGASVITPEGMVAPFAGTTPPAGWLKCDGSAISRTTYAALFNVIGTKYGAGDGSTTFNLPTQSVLPLGTSAPVAVFGGANYAGSLSVATPDRSKGYAILLPKNGFVYAGEPGASLDWQFTEPQAGQLYANLSQSTGAKAIVCIKY